MSAPVSITTAQSRWLKFRRSGLMEPFKNPAEAAQKLIGVQAQMPVASDLAFFNRVPELSMDDLSAERFDNRSIVRMWGQRNTVHIYATEDWPLLERWFRDHSSVMSAKLSDAGLANEFEKLVKYLEQRLKSGEQLIYKDAKSFKGFKKLDAVRKKWDVEQGGDGSSEWLIGFAVMMRLVRDGVVCHGPDENGESTFVHREHWVPKLKWAVPEDESVFSEAAVRYFQTYGPATPHDLASYFGTTVTAAKSWIEHAGDRIVGVTVDGQKMSICANDIKVATEKVPSPAKWPIRLLYRFDPYVLGAVGSRNKEWLLDKENFKKVWRPGAHIEAVVLIGGRIVGTWRYKRKSKGLSFEVNPFEPVNQRITREINKQVKLIADFLETDVIDLTIS